MHRIFFLALGGPSMSTQEISICKVKLQTSLTDSCLSQCHSLTVAAATLSIIWAFNYQRGVPNKFLSWGALRTYTPPRLKQGPVNREGERNMQKVKERRK